MEEEKFLKLEKNLKEKRELELQAQTKIEIERLNELAESLKTSLQTELNSIKEDIQKELKRISETTISNEKKAHTTILNIQKETVSLTRNYMTEMQRNFEKTKAGEKNKKSLTPLWVILSLLWTVAVVYLTKKYL